jgi:hypothetical protein
VGFASAVSILLLIITDTSLGHQISDHRVQCIESWHDGVERRLGGCLREIKLVEPRVGRSNCGIHPLVDRLDVCDKAINLSLHVLQVFLVVVACHG